MAFLCPACSRLGLEIRESAELGSNSSSDERAIQIVACRACGFEGVALYEESRRGSLGSESVRHHGYRADPERLNEVRRLMAGGETRGVEEILSLLARESTSFEMKLEPAE